MTDPLARLTDFGRRLRASGVPVGTDRIASFCRAAALAPEDLYWVGCATLLGSREHLATYDRLFSGFFGTGPLDHPRTAPRPGSRPGTTTQLRAVAAADDSGLHGGSLASRTELLRTKSFARCSPAELAQLAELMKQVAVTIPRRRSRRRGPSSAGAPDLRRTLRRSFRTGGEPLERAWRERRRRRRRLVLVLDVSGSMASYSRALLVFAHAALRADRRFEAFCFSTRLTRLTRALDVASPEEALDRAAAQVVDWDGGTRIGEAVERLLGEAGHGGLARGAVVVICSDGLDVGDPVLLAEQMERLSRLAYRVVWLNPLREHPRYEPLARGMRAALPHVDSFASGHNLASLEALAAELSAL